MAKAKPRVKSASFPSQPKSTPSATGPGMQEATAVDPSADRGHPLRPRKKETVTFTRVYTRRSKCSTTQPGKQLEATTAGPSADNGELLHFPAALRRPRSDGRRRVLDTYRFDILVNVCCVALASTQS